jgi:type VI secretion system protein ImpB
MGKEGSVAPKERVNIVYKPAGGDSQSEVELPMKILAIGDYTGRADDTPLEDRKPINIDKDNFNEVMASHKLELTLSVADKLSGTEGGELPVSLKFNKLSDFGPEAIVEQVPELRKLMELRAALHALKGPLGSIAGFRKKIQALLGDEKSRQKLMSELGLGDEKKGE